MLVHNRQRYFSSNFMTINLGVEQVNVADTKSKCKLRTRLVVRL